MKQPAKQYMVWTGSAWWPTWAVSEAKAISNIVWRMKQMGKFPNRSQFEAKLIGGVSEERSVK